RATASTNATSLAYPANITSGDLLVVTGGLCGCASLPSVTVSDTRGTVYTVLLGCAVAITERTFIAYGIATSSGADTVSISTAGTQSNFAIDEFSGVNATPLDVDGGTGTGTGTTASNSITPTQTNDLIIGVTTNDGASPTITPGGSYTQIG